MWRCAERCDAESRVCSVPPRRASIRLRAGGAVSLSSQALGCPRGRRAEEAGSYQLQRRQGEALPCLAWEHAPIVPANNGEELELMTQTQVQGAAGWRLKGSTVCAVVTTPALPALPG